MLELLFDWQSALSMGTDVLVYLIMALVGTTFFVLRLLIALFFGGGGEFDTGVDLDAGTDASFGLFSLLSILAFFMGAGWMGITCRIDWQMGSLASAASAAAFGFGLMVLASGLMLMARRLNKTIEYDLNTAIGKSARVYMSIPAQGRGQVEVDVSGRRKVLEAVGQGEKISEFSTVRVVAVRDDQTLIVEPLE